MATKIISSAERIIFSGHARTKEECETISLACEELAKSDKFRTVKYESGYAEFEKVGVARELKFAAMPYTVNFTFDSGVEKIAWSRDKNLIAGNYIYTSPGEIPSSNISSFGFCVILLSGYEIANVNIPTDVLGSGNVEKLTDTTYWIMTDGGMDIDITITTKQSTSKVSIDLTTLSGWANLAPGSHTIKIVAKGTGYRDSEKSAGVSVTKPVPGYTDCLTFTGETSEFTLKATNKDWNGTLQWSTDHNTWTTLAGTEAMQSVGKKLYLRGKGNTTFGAGSGVRWQLSAKAGCSGNIQTLLDWENPPTSISETYCYYSMFDGCTSLTTAPNLPATTLAEYCYSGMFSSCTSLTTAPNLPATTLAKYCYYSMFRGCTNLTTAPTLSATTLAGYCYNYMFSSCTSLTTAPNLPATTLAEYCYSGMFRGCTNLTTAPELPATTLAGDCYSGMFRGCTNLTTAPELPATTLAGYCYSGMFRGCTNLTTAPELPATTLAKYCYYSMFDGCTSLTTAPNLPATTLAEYCYSGMFDGCTNLTTAPTLSATTLAGDCYSGMFRGCTNLTTAPNLPATTLAIFCYNYMFNGCTKLKINTSSGNNIFTCPTTIPAKAVSNMFDNTGGTFTGTPTAGNTYYWTE